MRPLSNEINAIFVYEVICRVCESLSVSSARALYLVNLLVAVWCRWEAEVLLVWLCFAGSSLKLRMSQLRDGDDDDDGGAVSAALVTTGREGLDG